MDSSLPGADADIIEAVVQVGTKETRYLRCGRGANVVLLLSESEGERLRLVRLLAADHCVIAPMPDVCPAATVLAVWLHGVIDGLGLDRPTLVLSPGLSHLGELLATACGESLGPVLTEGAPEPG